MGIERPKGDFNILKYKIYKCLQKTWEYALVVLNEYNLDAILHALLPVIQFF